MSCRPFHQAILPGVLTLLISGVFQHGHAEDQIDLLLRGGRVPKDMIREHGYSDFTEPVGRFLDLLAAGAFSEAREIQPKACATWLATRQDSALTGKAWVWDTEIDLNTLCAQR